MKKRLFDCDCWKDPWFRKLQPTYKLFWIFLLTSCECWGEWKPDAELVSFFIGYNVKLDKYLMEINKDNKKRVEILSNGNWFITGFIFFQYGQLSDKCNAHKPVLENLARLKKEGYLKGTHRDHNKNKDKDKKKDKNKEPLFDFELIYSKYPNKESKDKSREHFTKSVVSEQDFINIQKALDRYLIHLKDNEWKKPQSAKTWFNNWTDWIDYTEPVNEQSEQDKYEAKLRKVGLR